MSHINRAEDRNLQQNISYVYFSQAVESRNYSSVQHLLNTRADPDVMDEFGRTPLHIAAKIGDIPAVQLLLDRGARTDAVEMVSGRELTCSYSVEIIIGNR